MYVRVLCAVPMDRELGIGPLKRLTGTMACPLQAILKARRGELRSAGTDRTSCHLLACVLYTV